MATETNADDRLITLNEAAGELPRRRQGRKIHLATLYRWTTSGCRGEKLQYVQVGATRCTTRRWLDEFFERLTQASRGGASPQGGSPSIISSARRKAEQERVARELDRIGI